MNYKSASETAGLTSCRDVADMFPNAEVIGKPPNDHGKSLCTNASIQEAISPQPSDQVRPKISVS